MKTIRILLFVLTLALSTGAFAWPSCSGNWVSVPKSTTSANGVLYSTGDLLFQCQTPAPPVTPTTPSSNKNKNNNTNQSASSSSSSAGAVAGSSSSATGGTGVGTGVATATGGQGGNSSQGQNQGQSQTSSSSANGNGNGSNNTQYNSETNIAAPKIPVATAYAPSVFPTVTCFKGFGGGVQTAPVGVSMGGGKIDENCAILEAAGRARNILTFCKVYITNKYVKKAGVSLQDCIEEQTLIAQAAVVEPTPEPPAIIVIPVGLTLQAPPVVLPVLVRAPRRHVVHRAVVKPVVPCRIAVRACIQ